MSKENPSPDKRRDKPPPPSQNPTNFSVHCLGLHD